MTNEKRNNFSFIIIIILCVSILGILIIPNFSFSTKKEVVSSFKRYHSSIVTGGSGTWNISQIFKETDNVTLDSLNSVIINSNSSNMDENKVTLISTVTLEEGTSIADLYSGDFAYLFDLSSIIKDDFYYDTNYDDNSLDIFDGNGNCVAKVYMGDILSSDYVYDNGLDIDPELYDFFWYYDDYDGGLVLYNVDDVGAGQNYSKTFEISIALDYDTYKNESVTIGSTLLFYVDEILSGDPISGEIAFDNGGTTVKPVKVKNLVKNNGDFYNTWQSEWGTYDNDDYFYVLYDLQYELVLNEALDVLVSPSLFDGELVAYGDGTDYTVGDLNDFINSSYATAAAGDNHCVFVVGYEKPSGDAALVKNFNVDIMAPGVYSQTASWTNTFNFLADAEYPKANANDISLSINDDNYGLGAINKINSGRDTNFVYTVESTSNEINANESGVLLKGFNNWYAGNYGEDDYTASLEFSNVYLTDRYGNGGVENKLGSEDYRISTIKLLDDKEYDYVLSQANNTYYLDNALLSSYTNKSVYVKTSNDSEWQIIGTYKKNSSGVIEYNAINPNTSFENGTIILPANTLQVKVEYVGKRAAVYVGYEVNVVLLHSSNVKNIINSNSNVYLKVDSESNSDSEDNYHMLTELASESSFDVFATDNGLQGSNNVIEYDVDFSQSIEYSSGEGSLARDLLTEERAGDFYILLSEGAVLDEPVTVNGYGDVTVNSVVTQEDRFNSSNRTLVKVHVSNAGGNYSDINNVLTTGYNLSLNINYSQVSNRDYGNNVKFDVMYVSDNEISGGYRSASSIENGILTSDDVKDIFAAIDLDNTRYNKVFEGVTTVIDPVTVMSGTAEAYVKTDDMSDYGTSGTIKEGYSYSYKLEYTYSDPLLIFNNLVFYDVLDGAYGTNEYVKGTFDSIDVDYLYDNLGIRPTIYYSTKMNMDLSNDSDLNNQNVWSQDMPSDKTKITAVAVDLGNYTFNGQDREIPMVYINMIGSTNYTKDNLYAYNNVFVKYYDKTSDSTKTSTSNTTKVKLEKALIDFELNARQDVTSSNLDHGAESSPASIERNFGYLYTIKSNDDSFDYQNIRISSSISSGVIVDNYNIRYYDDTYSNNKLITEDDTVTYTYDDINKSITLDIKKIDAGSEINVWLPVSVDVNTITSDAAIIVNQAKIDKLQGSAYKGTTVSTYNCISIPQINSNKFIKNENVFVTTDQEALKVNKNKAYTYMVKVSNNSDVVANNIEVVDNVPEGLLVDVNSISNNGSYNSSNNKITWNIDSLGANEEIELTYNISLPSNVPNNTRYSSNAHVKVTNPFNSSSNIYDADTNTIVIIYNTAADVVIKNKVSGALINNDKEFRYVFSINGHAYDAGEYIVTDNDNNELGKIIVDGSGKGDIAFVLSNGKKATVRNLPADLSYTISQYKEEGYSTLETNSVVVEDDDKSFVSGVTSDGTVDTYEFNNTYHASGSLNIAGRVSFNKDHNAGDFSFELTNASSSYQDIKGNDSNDIITFNPINYSDEIGNYEYRISQIILDNESIDYDDNFYKVFVKVTDNGDGTLKTEAKYYDKYDNEIQEILFNNVGLDYGLLVKNVYSGDYIYEDNKFDYEIEVTSDVDGEYDIINNEGEVIDTFTVQDGKGNYETSLGASEYVLIKEIPENSEYVVKMKLLQYYDSNVQGGNEEDGYLVVTGLVNGTTTKVVFDNEYKTEANYKPVINIVLNGKELQDSEFNFKIEDVSEKSSGYSEIATNDVDGVIGFSNITFNHPGTYVFEISQVKGDNANISYDENKVILTLVLVDNGDGTMDADAQYTFVDGRSTFVNTYAPNGMNVNPITDGGNNGIGNPNTIDYLVLVVFVLAGAFMFTLLVKFIKIKRFSN